MPYKSDFFPSLNGDRKYLAEDFANRFSKNYTNGILPNTDHELGDQLKVTAVEGTMKVQIGIGAANINGYYFEVYDEPVELELSAGSSSARTDRIVLELNLNEGTRAIVPKILEGQDGTDPVPLTQTSIVYQISVAKISIGADVVLITDDNITDERTDETLCGVSKVRAVPKATDAVDGLMSKEDHINLSYLLQTKPYIFQNGFINGDFQVWQNGTQNQLKSDTYQYDKGYAADMWQAVGQSARTLEINQSSGSLPLYKKAMTVYRRNGDTSLTPVIIRYLFPYGESTKYIGNKVTFSFLFKKLDNAAGTFEANIISINTQTNVIPVTTSTIFTPTTDMQLFVFTTQDVIPSGSTQLGVQIVYTPTNATAPYSDGFRMTNCMWTPTDFYVPFMSRSFGDELRDCMMYYQKSFPYGMRPTKDYYNAFELKPNFLGAMHLYGAELGGGMNSYTLRGEIILPVPMRRHVYDSTYDTFAPIMTAYGCFTGTIATDNEWCGVYFDDNAGEVRSYDRFSIGQNSLDFMGATDLFQKVAYRRNIYVEYTYPELNTNIYGHYVFDSRPSEFL